MEGLLALLFLFVPLALIAAVAWSIGRRRTRQEQMRRVPLPRSGRPAIPAASTAPATPVRPTTATPASPASPRPVTPTSSWSGPSTAPVSGLPDQVPTSLPVTAKQWFFSRSESAFFKALEAALPAGYRVFPNVRLNDLFLIRSGAQQRATYARLRDKHVDFLIVRTEDFRPWLAIELDGASHDQAQQQYRDAVKNVAFRSAGLPLLRVRAESPYGPAELRLLLAPYLGGRVVA